MYISSESNMSVNTHITHYYSALMINIHDIYALEIRGFVRGKHFSNLLARFDTVFSIVFLFYGNFHIFRVL